jgi:hypothetical protein
MAAKLTKLTHKITMQLRLEADSCTDLQFSLQAASPETFGYTPVKWSCPCTLTEHHAMKAYYGVEV